MELQRILFPSAAICTNELLYYRADRAQINHLSAAGALCLRPDESISFDTYFNSFSIYKWKTYTKLTNLSLQLTVAGKCSVTLCHVRKINNRIVQHDIAVETLDAAQKSCFTLPFILDETMGLYYFSIKAFDEKVQFFGGAYLCDIPEERCNPVNLAVGICTFRRELYIENNLRLLQNQVLENERSPLHGHLQIYISDNGQTLDLEKWNQPGIHLVHNKNTGGAGGFTRCMIEICDSRDEYGHSHILLMDDDILLDPAVAERTYCFLRLLRDEHQDAFLGGGMLHLDQKEIQREAADFYKESIQRAVKYDYNLTDLNFLIKNEVEDSINYFSWWYCCMPLSIITDENLPLPLFIKRDDIEYGLRNGRTFITLNGIGVWHEAFEYKRSSYLEYYYIRNTCIINAIHRPDFGRIQTAKLIMDYALKNIVLYRYSDARLQMMGIIDFCKGVDWFKQQDGAALNGLIMKCAYQKKPISELDCVFVHGVLEGTIAKPELSKKHKLTLLGWLLPAKGTQLVSAVKPSPSAIYRKKRLLNYEDISGLAFETFKSYRLAFQSLWQLTKVLLLIFTRYPKAKREYAARWHELTNRSFWNHYLMAEGTADPQGKKPFAEFVPSFKRRAKAGLKYCHTVFLRFLQHCLFFVPTKRRRVTVYLHNRHGYTCNLKYLVNDLHRRYGNRLDIGFASDYPNSCAEVQAMGIRVLPLKSLRFFLHYFTSRVIVSNDSFPAYLVKRRGQYSINTWHGGINYKHIGLPSLAPRTRLEINLFRKANRQPDYYVSGCAAFAQDTAESFGFDSSVFQPCGLPRNDVFFGDTAALNKKVRKHYHIAEKTKIVLFAPTFRRGMKHSTYGLNFEQLTKALRERFGGDWVVLFRCHYFVASKLAQRNVIDASEYHDMQELLCAADVLVSDYSSCMWDYALTGRPCFVFASDLRQFSASDRDFAIPPALWPYPLAQNNDALTQEILQFNAEAYAENLKQHLQDMGSYDRGDASQTVSDEIARQCKLL